MKKGRPGPPGGSSFGMSRKRESKMPPALRATKKGQKEWGFFKGGKRASLSNSFRRRDGPHRGVNKEKVLLINGNW